MKKIDNKECRTCGKILRKSIYGKTLNPKVIALMKKDLQNVGLQ